MSCAIENACRLVATNSPVSVSRGAKATLCSSRSIRSVFFFTSAKKLSICSSEPTSHGKIGVSGAEGPGQFLDIVLQPLALVIENQLRARLVPRLRDRPRDAALVGHAEDNAGLAGQRKMNTHSPESCQARETRKEELFLFWVARTTCCPSPGLADQGVTAVARIFGDLLSTAATRTTSCPGHQCR